MTITKKIRELVKKIPRGKVTTYGQVARAVGTRDNRLVGWMLHQNKDSTVPCHRVVFKDGSLAPGYVFGGPKEQKRRLKKEGVKFVNETQVNLKNHLWRPDSFKYFK